MLYSYVIGHSNTGYILCYIINKVYVLTPHTPHTPPCFPSKRYPQVTAQESQVDIGRHNNRLLVGKPEGMRLLGRPRCRWVDNIRMDLGEVGWGDVDWIGLEQDRNR
jgi:hypothetical protein